MRRLHVRRNLVLHEFEKSSPTPAARSINATSPAAAHFKILPKDVSPRKLYGKQLDQVPRRLRERTQLSTFAALIALDQAMRPLGT
jgi:hypothetical protein